MGRDTPPLYKKSRTESSAGLLLDRGDYYELRPGMQVIIAPK